MTTKELITALQPFEREINNVIFSKFLRQMEKSKVDELLKIHKEYYGTDFYIQPFCSKCVMDLVAKLGALYLKAISCDETANEIKEKMTKKPVIKNKKK